jgi:hypothetical protein
MDRRDEASRTQDEREDRKAKAHPARLASRVRPDPAARESEEEERPARSPIRTPREPGEARVAEPEPPYGDLSGEPEMQGIGEERAWEPWSAEEDVYAHMGGDRPATAVHEDTTGRGDPMIEREIRERLDGHQGIDARLVTVTVHGGEVVLDGAVDSPLTRATIEQIASETLGVRAVHDRLDVARR